MSTRVSPLQRPRIGIWSTIIFGGRGEPLESDEGWGKLKKAQVITNKLSIEWKKILQAEIPSTPPPPPITFLLVCLLGFEYE